MKDLIKYILGLIIFGSNGIVASFLGLGSTKTVLLRTLLGTLFLIAVFALAKQKCTFKQHKKDFAFLLLSGIFMGFSWIFLYEAYGLVSVSVASLTYYCGPIIVMALSPIILKSKIKFPEVICFAFVILGIFLTNFSFESKKADSFGILCGIMSAVFYAGMVISNKKAAKISGCENSMFQLGTSFLTVFVFALISGDTDFSSAGNFIIPILVLGIMNTGLGCLLYFSSMNKLPVVTVTVCGYIEPLSAIIFSVIFLGERLSPLQTPGALLIMGGALACQLYRLKKRL